MTRTKVIEDDVLGAFLRETWSGENLSDYFEIRKIEKADALTAEQLLDAIEAWASEQLIRSKWPSPFEVVDVSEGGSWSTRSREDTRPHKNAHIGHAFILKNVSLLSDEAFLCRIAKYARSAKGHFIEGNLERLLRAALKLGMQFKELELRRRGLKLAERGNNVAGGAKNAARWVNRRHDKPRALRFDRMQHHLDQGLSIEKAAQACEHEGLGKQGAIKRQWNRHKKKRDT